MWRRWSLFRQFKLNLIRLMRLRDSPNHIARGMALGLFLGMTPTFGFQMALAFFVALLLRENKISAVIGVWITNPVTAPFIYGLEYETGRVLLGMPHPNMPLQYNYHFLTQIGWEVLVPLGFGSLLFAIVTAALGYALTLHLVPLLRLWRIPRWPRRRPKNNSAS